MGMSAASAATFSMVPSKRLTTAAARKAVTRLMPSHTRRRRVEGITPANTSSSSRRPAADMTSCAASSRMTSTTSSTVMRPSSLPASSTTAADTRSRSWNSRETSLACSVGRDARRLGVEDVADRLFRILGEQARQRDGAEIAVVAVDHEQPVGLVGQLAAHAQVAQHHFHGDVGAHAHGVGVHEAAGGVRLVRQHGVQALAVLRVHGLHAAARPRPRAGRRPGRRGRRAPCPRPRPAVPRRPCPR